MNSQLWYIICNLIYDATNFYLPWVPEAFHAPFLVSVKSGQSRVGSWLTKLFVARKSKALLPRVIYTQNVFFFNFRRHHLSRRRVIPLPKTKANPVTHPQALFQKDQVSGKLKCKVTHKMCVSNAMFVHITLFLIGRGRE